MHNHLPSFGPDDKNLRTARGRFPGCGGRLGGEIEHNLLQRLEDAKNIKQFSREGRVIALMVYIAGNYIFA
ncbi:MAG: hypothetical protein R3C14_07360 [Caldilineaceae bacterium]